VVYTKIDANGHKSWFRWDLTALRQRYDHALPSRYFEYEIVCVPLESGNDDDDALGARNSTDDLIAAASAAILGKNSSANTSDVGGTLDTVIMDSVTITT